MNPIDLPGYKAVKDDMRAMVDAAGIAWKTSDDVHRIGVRTGREVHETICVPGTDDIDEKAYDDWYDSLKVLYPDKPHTHTVAIKIAALRLYVNVRDAAKVLNELIG